MTLNAARKIVTPPVHASYVYTSTTVSVYRYTLYAMYVRAYIILHLYTVYTTPSIRYPSPTSLPESRATLLLVAINYCTVRMYIPVVGE